MRRHEIRRVLPTCLRNCICFYALRGLARHLEQHVGKAVARAGKELRQDGIQSDWARYVLEQVKCGAGVS